MGIDKIIYITVVLFTHFLYTKMLKTGMIYSMEKNLLQYTKNVRALRAHQPWLCYFANFEQDRLIICSSDQN